MNMFKKAKRVAPLAPSKDFKGQSPSQARRAPLNPSQALLTHLGELDPEGEDPEGWQDDEFSSKDW